MDGRSWDIASAIYVPDQGGRVVDSGRKPSEHPSEYDPSKDIARHLEQQLADHFSKKTENDNDVKDTGCRLG